MDKLAIKLGYRALLVASVLQTGDVVPFTFRGKLNNIYIGYKIEHLSFSNED